MGYRDNVTKVAAGAVLLGLLLYGCTTAPTLSDAAVIWCDENRWQVTGRAAQLGLAVPTTNPAESVIIAEESKKVEEVEAQRRAGKVVREAVIRQLRSSSDALHHATSQYESGEWDPSGVTDVDWADYQDSESRAYTRACSAAYELSKSG